LGIRTTLKYYKSKSFYSYNNLSWRLTLFKKNNKLYIGELIRRRKNMKKVVHEGLIWCPTTQNKTWLARRNGTVYFTGNSNDPTAAGRQAIKGKTLYILEEMIYELGLTNNLIADRLKPIINKEYIRCDNEPKSIAELRGYGIEALAAKKGPGSVNFGIQYLKQFEIVIDIRCQNAINEIQQYQWKKNKDGETINEPVDRNNHFLDQVRYALNDRIFEREKEEVYTASGLGIF